MEILNELNDKQYLAATTTDVNVRIVAGAGSGKTKVVTTRIAHLIEDLGVLPNRILAITFTNKAANEMKDRIANILNVKESGVNVSTIHSFCVRVLREDIVKLGYPRNFVILDSDDQKSVLKDIYKKLNIDLKTISYGQALSYISNNKTLLIDPDTCYNSSLYPIDILKAQIYLEYQNTLNTMQVLDFDDLLILTYKLFKKDLNVREKWQMRFDFIHVDEFQDVDELQYNIIKYLVKDTTKLCVVGDPDQTIYTWRGAKVDIIMNFDKDFPDCKSIILNQNYRSTQTILSAANKLIQNNENRLEKELFTDNLDDHKIEYYESNDEKFEAMWISEKITNLIKEGNNYSDIAILYRSNYLSRNLEKVLLDSQIPYRIYGGVKFFERAEIKDALSYLRLLIDNNQSYSKLAIKRILNVPKRGVGIKTFENIENISNLNNEDYFEVIKNNVVAKGKAQNEINKFVKMIDTVRNMKDEYSISVLLKRLLDDSGYLKMLEENHEDERIENINELLSDINNYEENNPDGTLDDYLQMISLYTDAQDSESSTGNVVQLMSVHSAKGLEFNHVFVYSLCEGIFPNERSINEGGDEALEEERRLAYVAFTRARKRLYLSSSQGFSYITNKIKTPSRFINEIGSDLLEKQGEIYNSYSQEKSQAEKNINKDFTNSSILSNLNKSTLTTNKKVKLKKGDIIEHVSFGEGVIISVKDGVATIAFKKKYGVKKIAANHKSLIKK